MVTMFVENDSALSCRDGLSSISIFSQLSVAPLDLNLVLEFLERQQPDCCLLPGLRTDRPLLSHRGENDVSTSLLRLSIDNKSSRFHTITMHSTEPWLQQRTSRRQHAALQIAQHDPPPEQTSGFFKLSAELRNLIYEDLIIEHDDALWVTADRHSVAEDIGPGPTPPPITQVSRLLRDETLPIYYGVNTFSISLMRERNVRMAKRWLAAVGDVGVSRMRRLRLRSYAWGEYRHQCPIDISLLINAVGVSKTNGDGDGKDASAVAGLLIDPEPKWPQIQAIDAARCVQEAAGAARLVGNDLPSMDTFQSMLETFASLCAFRNDPPPQSDREKYIR